MKKMRGHSGKEREKEYGNGKESAKADRKVYVKAEGRGPGKRWLLASPDFYKRGCSLAFVGAACFFLIRYAYVWKWVEGLSLFVPGEAFFRPFLRIPGGMLAYAGSFLTQLLYYPVAGCLIFVGLLYAVQGLTIRAFRLPDRFYPLSFIPSLLLLAAVLNVGYTWATLKAPGHFFVPALGCCFFLSCCWLYRQIGNGYARMGMALLVTAAYPLFGFYALFGAGLCLMQEWLEKTGKLRFCLILAGAAMIWLVPKLYYFGVDGTEQEISRLYVAGLPPFFIRRAELMLWMPYLLLFGCYVFFTLLAEICKVSGQTIPDATERKPDGRMRLASAAVFGVALLFTATQAYGNENFEAGVRSNLAIEAGDWQEAAERVGRVTQNPTRDVAVNGQLADLYLGKPPFPAEAPPLPLTYKDARPGLLTFMQLSGLQMNYYGGQINVCYRWAVELSIEYGWQVSRLKLLVKCALLNGEPELAQKYNNLLKRTLFHKKWAEKYQAYIDHPERMKHDREFARIPKDMLPDRFVE